MVELARLPSGVDGLDPILGGGFVEGASYIIQGLPGAGKTILSNQIAFAQAASGRRVLYVTLLAETHERLFQSLATMSFFDRAMLGDAIKYVSVFQSLRDEGLGAVVRLIREETQRQQATLLVFDGLLNARDLAATELDVKTFVAELQSQAAFVDCTVLFLTSTSRQDSSPEHTMVDGVIDLNDETVGVRSYRHLQVRKSRGSASLAGSHQFQIGENGITVFPRLEALLERPSVEENPSAQRRATGIKNLDAVMNGGLPTGSITVLAGPPGSGKTTFGLNFLDLASTNEPALLFGFYETPARLLLKSATLGVDLERKVASGAVELLWNPLTENILDRLGYQLLDAVRKRNVRRLVIDGMGGFERAAMHQPRLVEFFAALTNELRARDVTTLMTWELRDLSKKGGSSPLPDISAVLDNLIELRQIARGPAPKRVMSILKIRDSVFNPNIYELRFASGGLSVVDPEHAIDLDPANRVPRQEA